MKLIRKTSEPQQVATEQGGNMLFKLLPYWPLFAILFAVALACSWVYLKMTPPLYEATARIMINEKKGADELKSDAPMQTTAPKKTIDNEREMIMSNPILYKVVENLSLYAPVYTKTALSKDVAYQSSPVQIVAKDPKSIKASEPVAFTFAQSAVTIEGKKYPLNTWVNTPYGMLMFMMNTHNKNLQRNGDFFFSLMTEKKAAATLGSRIKVAEANKLSTILSVTLTDEDPVRAEDILNDVLKVYNNAAIDEQNKLAANTMEFISQRLAGVQSELLAIESNLQNYRTVEGAVDVGTQGKLYLENVSNNDQKVGEINMQLSVLDQVESSVRSNNLANGVVPSTVGVNDPGLSQMVKNIYELQLNAESLKKTTGENNPMYVSYIDQINKIKPQIVQNLQNQRASLQASRKNLSSTTSNYSSALQTMPEKERKMVDISRQQQIKSNIYTFLLQKKEETALSYISNGSGSKVVNNAESSEFPVSPKRKMIYLAALFGAGIIGLGFVTAKEGLRTNVMFQSDIEKLTRLPVIAEISTDKSNRAIVMGGQQRTLIAEQFRSLRTTLRYLGVSSTHKRVMVTSAISGEGKSFVASNLAITLAMTGKKVALLDFDLNNPTLHRKFNIKQTVGITEYLQGAITADKAIIPSGQNENLSLLLTGALPMDPSELILSNRTEELLNYLDEKFDYIVLDVPPVGPVSDAYTLAQFCDATLYVVRHAYTPKAFVERIDENIKLNNLPNPAIVFNAVAPRGFGKNYGYGYGSGMVYGGSYDQKRISIDSGK
ncbi:capsular exopolysaccharide family [Pedobacter westerhofensis]|uniref:Capsular exopolysaccharide family n=1 Tax=Pedobacter westerhofensis TaxID=425512 RepID=A0A521FK54_9SPHI|nr:tyrosine-protein kinase family protein [Pedobacter westerhofensis]SMO96499.1 capsular exopolysaccharide family [Pedobacter westerhofensis]